MNQYDKEKLMIEQIIDNFDFYKCWTVMKLLEWSWGFEAEIPNVERLKSSAVSRLRDAMKIAKEGENHKFTYTVSSGGLKASAWKNRYGHIESVRLEFVLTDWDADGD